jgi:hypothetical protein
MARTARLLPGLPDLPWDCGFNTLLPNPRKPGLMQWALFYFPLCDLFVSLWFFPCPFVNSALCDQKTSKFFVSHLEESMVGHMGINGVY